MEEEQRVPDEETTADAQPATEGEAEEEEALTPEERATIDSIREAITPDRMFMPFILDQQEIITPEGAVMVRYVMGFVNQTGRVLAAPGVNNTRVPAKLIFTNDTGRRTIAHARRPRPGDNGTGGFRRGTLPR